MGARFSTNALDAALWSSVIIVRTMFTASKSSTSPSVPWAAAFRFFYM
jgi:hypothetical protein